MSLEELLQACSLTGDAAAWEEFLRRFHSLIAAVVLRTAHRYGKNSSSLADDLIQETYLKICRDRVQLLREFEPHHPEAFYGYLKVITANVVHDYFRARHSHKRGGGQPDTSIEEHGMAFPRTKDSTDAIHRDILLTQVDDALSAGLSGNEATRDKSIFWLYYRYGLTAAAIARLPSISLTVKGVESVIHRLTAMAREVLSEDERPANGAEEKGGRVPGTL